MKQLKPLKDLTAAVEEDSKMIILPIKTSPFIYNKKREFPAGIPQRNVFHSGFPLCILYSQKSQSVTGKASGFLSSLLLNSANIHNAKGITS